MKTAREIIDNIEAHVGTKIEDKRLKFHLVQAIQRELDKYNGLRNNLTQLLEIKHPVVIDSARQKAIARRDIKE